jgi:hypothetical protein
LLIEIATITTTMLPLLLFIIFIIKCCSFLQLRALKNENELEILKVYLCQ